jgi:DNA-binding transcriptional LysR family regulator
MEIEDIQAFVAVADAGGLTPAAGRLGVSKSIVSRRIARLEKSLKTQLLTRTTRGAALTEAGATFREHASRAASRLSAGGSWRARPIYRNMARRARRMICSRTRRSIASMMSGC